MDRALIISYLQAAEDHVANGEQLIANQCGLISSLERAGDDASSAIALLHQMEGTQMQRIANREWLRAELAVLNVDAGDTEGHASKQSVGRD